MIFFFVFVILTSVLSSFIINRRWNTFDVQSSASGHLQSKNTPNQRLEFWPSNHSHLGVSPKQVLIALKSNYH